MCFFRFSSQSPASTCLGTHSHELLVGWMGCMAPLASWFYDAESKGAEVCYFSGIFSLLFTIVKWRAGPLFDIRLSGGNCGGEDLSPPGKEGATETQALVLRLTPQCNGGWGLRGWTMAEPGAHCLRWLETRAGDPSVGLLLTPRPLPSLPSLSRRLDLLCSISSFCKDGVLESQDPSTFWPCLYPTPHPAPCHMSRVSGAWAPYRKGRRYSGEELPASSYNVGQGLGLERGKVREVVQVVVSNPGSLYFYICV